MRTIARAEGVDAAAFFSLEDVDVGLEHGVAGQTARFGDDQPSVDLFSSHSPHQHSHVVSGLPVVQGLVEGFDADDFGFEGFVVAVELDGVSDFDSALFDCAAGHCTPARCAVGAFHGHVERFVDCSA